MIVVLGSANMDLVATAPRLPGPGETVLGHGFRTVPGGKGANQAIAVARAGGECAFLGAVGRDDFGVALRATLAGAGVDVAALRAVDGPSGVALITVDDAGENCIVVAPGANAFTGLAAADRDLIARADLLLCQLEVPLETVVEGAAVARAHGTRVMLNAAPARALPRELLDLVDVLVVNEHEHAIVGAAAVPSTVRTLGARGAVADGVAVPAPAVTAVDTTAAGDAFTGAYAVALVEGRPTGDALRWACAAGALCATRPGASSALPTRAEIDELYLTPPPPDNQPHPGAAAPTPDWSA
jgi:ribokinase